MSEYIALGFMLALIGAAISLLGMFIEKLLPEGRVKKLLAKRFFE